MTFPVAQPPAPTAGQPYGLMPPVSARVGSDKDAAQRSPSQVNTRGAALPPPISEGEEPSYSDSDSGESISYSASEESDDERDVTDSPSAAATPQERFDQAQRDVILKAYNQELKTLASSARPPRPVHSIGHFDYIPVDFLISYILKNQSALGGGTVADICKRLSVDLMDRLRGVVPYLNKDGTVPLCFQIDFALRVGGEDPHVIYGALGVRTADSEIAKQITFITEARAHFKVNSINDISVQDKIEFVLAKHKDEENHIKSDALQMLGIDMHDEINAVTSMRTRCVKPGTNIGRYTVTALFNYQHSSDDFKAFLSIVMQYDGLLPHQVAKKPGLYEFVTVGYIDATETTPNAEGHLDLSKKGLVLVPHNVYEHEGLRSLNLGGNALRAIEIKIFSSTLIDLDLRNNALTEIPECMLKLTQLESLNLSQNELRSLHKDLGVLKGLKKLYLAHNHLTALPNFSKLEELDLQGNDFTALPGSVFKSKTTLRILNMSGSKLSSRLEKMVELTALIALHVKGCDFNQFPESLLTLSQLEFLDLSENQIRTLPDGMLSALSNLRQLHLAKNMLTGTFKELGKAACLTHLNCAENRFIEFPFKADQIPNLQVLNLNGQTAPIGSAMGTKIIPECSRSVAKLKCLKELYITGVTFGKIGSSYRLPADLEVFMASGVPDVSLPKAFKKAHKLRVLSLIKGHLETLPAWFRELPLKELNLQGNNLLGGSLAHIPVSVERLNLTGNRKLTYANLTSVLSGLKGITHFTFNSWCAIPMFKSGNVVIDWSKMTTLQSLSLQNLSFKNSAKIVVPPHLRRLDLTGAQCVGLKVYKLPDACRLLSSGKEKTKMIREGELPLLKMWEWGKPIVSNVPSLLVMYQFLSALGKQHSWLAKCGLVEKSIAFNDELTLS